MNGNRKIIGVCGARIFDQNAMKFIEELRRMGREEDYFTIAFSSTIGDVHDTDEILAEHQLFELTRYVDFSSLIILTETLKNQGLIQIIRKIGKEKNIPVFSVDGVVDGCYNLVLSYGDGFEKMVHHVIEEHGVRRVNMLAGFKGNDFSEERVAIYRKVLQEHGIPVEEERIGYGDFWDRPSRKAVKKFLDSDLPLPQAIICANDAMAITACSVLNEEGYGVPEDVIVTGFDGIQMGKLHFPTLTTCEPDYRSALGFIVQEIRKAEETGKVQPCDYIVKFEISKDQSCGCKPKVFSNQNGVISKLYEEVGDCAWHNIAMGQMVTSVLHKQKIMDIAEILPDNVRLWNDHFRFACVKSGLLQTGELEEECPEMVTILRISHEMFEKPGETFSVTEFIPRLENMVEEKNGADTLIVRLLNSGKKVYGYIVEGFEELDDRRLQRCNEFAMFLAHSINMVLHNRKLNELNHNLSNAYNEIATLYIQDAMTGIYNRRGFFQKLNELIRNPSSQRKYLYMISIDMDGLKYINDTFGHAEGDFAIITLAKAITQVSGTDAICARFGGDEFLCVRLEETKTEYQEKQFTRQLNRCIQAGEGVAEKPYPITASVGISCKQIIGDVDTDAMILSADELMYKDKVARRKQRGN